MGFLIGFVAGLRQQVGDEYLGAWGAEGRDAVGRAQRLVGTGVAFMSVRLNRAGAIR